MDGPDVVVAVVDSGVDYNHPDLKDAMWKNPGMATTAILLCLLLFKVFLRSREYCLWIINVPLLSRL